MADKPTKAELAKLPGGADFDVDNASSEDFDKHTEILRRRKAVADLTAPVQQVALVDAPVAASTGYSLPEVTKVRKDNGNPISMPEKAWSLLPAEDLEQFEDAPTHVDKPKD